MNSCCLADALECYMGQLVQSFQDFVKKTLLLMTVGLAAIVGVLYYLLNGTKHSTSGDAIPLANPDNLTNIDKEDNIKSRRSVKMRNMSSQCHLLCEKSCKTTDVNHDPPLEKKRSIEERVIKNTTFSSSKLPTARNANSKHSSFIRSRPPAYYDPPSKGNSAQSLQPKSCKPVISSLPKCSKAISKKNSCCSVCCEDQNKY